ncbi:head GIN domain-containing protein [Devosia ginsengisoli]|nr:head GIN domain-containing protein [Devosia ginsengisoli]
MRRSIAIATTATASLLLGSAAFAQSADYDFSGFDRVDIATGLDARITQGDSFSVRAESRSQDALDHLQISVDGGTLTARFEQSFLDFIISGGLVGQLLNSGNAITIDITMPALAGVTASSGADVGVIAVTSERLELDASSGADIKVTDAVLGHAIVSASSGSDIEISGSADTVEADASSGSDIDADDLVASNVAAEASSGANVSVHATAGIKADASSGGDIEVRGNPADRDVDTSSGGDVSFDD